MTETPLRPLHEAAGATMAAYFDCLLPAAFTDVAKEYDYARKSVAVMDTNYRAILMLEGPDRVRYLNAVVTNDIRALATGEGCIALLLNPQGHILAELQYHALADRLLVLSHAMVRERTVATLDRFIIMDDVTLTDITDQMGSVAVEGPKASLIVRELCGAALDGMKDFAVIETSIGTQPCRLIRRSHFGGVGAEIVAARVSLPEIWRILSEAARSNDGGAIGYGALNALRLQAGVPWFRYDFDDTVIPHEAGLESTHISYSKGCYTGQEIVERVRSRGQVNRKRVGLEFSSRTVPEHGTKLISNDKEAGWVTSAAFSPELNRVIGMGYLRREHHAPGSRVEYLDGEATVVALPPAGWG